MLSLQCQHRFLPHPSPIKKKKKEEKKKKERKLSTDLNVGGRGIETGFHPLGKVSVKVQ